MTSDDELTKKHIAFSEDALSEQIRTLTDIVNQQANAIQSLSASIVQLSAARFGLEVPSHVGRMNGTALNSKSSGNSVSRSDEFIHSSLPLSKVPTFDPPQAKRLASSSSHLSNGHVIKSEYKRLKKSGSVLEEYHSVTPDNSGEETCIVPIEAVPDAEKSQEAKNTLLTQLVALRDTCPFEERVGVVRARLCSDWMAIRPEELLARLRAVGMDVGTRKDFMSSVMNIGPGIVRGRSVKFGRDTRRALAISRMHFNPEELAIIDDSFLRGRSGKTDSFIEDVDDGDLNDDIV